MFPAGQVTFHPGLAEESVWELGQGQYWHGVPVVGKSYIADWQFKVRCDGGLSYCKFVRHSLVSLKVSIINNSKMR